MMCSASDLFPKHMHILHVSYLKSFSFKLNQSIIDNKLNYAIILKQQIRQSFVAWMKAVPNNQATL